MPHKQIALDLAAFLDSPQAQAVGSPAADVREIAESFLAACYDDVGKAPRLLDGQDLHGIVGHLLPGRIAKRAAERAPAVLAAYLDHLEATQVVAQSFEVRRALEETLPEFLEAARTGRSAHHAPSTPQQPFVHRAHKLGRNDPCSCGSGKKYKKCHGKEA